MLMAMLLGGGLLWQQSRLPAGCFWLSRVGCLARLGAGMDRQPSEIWSRGPGHGSAQLLLARDGRYQIYVVADHVDGSADVAEVGHWREASGELTLQPQLGGETAARWYRKCFQGQYYLTRSPHPTDMARQVQAWHQDDWGSLPPLPSVAHEAEALWRGGLASDCPGG
ncbi:hypothetical protein ABGV49_08975 [Chromobacterium vaccinii]|uniref:Uncharacterized protein n=2 Tax=Chromobacterium vaccinii TaxID=1108595 RepID=A0ABV0FDJ1_9NEIS